jgi:hypothetical protein
MLVIKEDIRQKLYRLPEAKKEFVRKEIDLLLELGIIVESESSFASPIVLVPLEKSRLDM